jgi:NADH:ubiquinone oxidoreductase subunit 4 (subunit M)
MGFVFLGIASLNLIGVTGAVLVMIAHGLLAALTFGLSGYLYQQTGTVQMDRLGGLLRRLPFIGAALMMAAFAGCGLPGFANFAGEIAVFFGAWKTFKLVTIAACWGALIIGAVYMLRAVRALLHGPLPEQWAAVADAPHLWRKAPFILLLASLLVFGCFPRLLTDKIQPSVSEKVIAAIAPKASSSPTAAMLLSPNLTAPSHEPAIPEALPTIPPLPFRRGEGRGEGSVLSMGLMVPMRGKTAVETTHGWAAGAPTR